MWELVTDVYTPRTAGLTALDSQTAPQFVVNNPDLRLSYVEQGIYRMASLPKQILPNQVVNERPKRSTSGDLQYTSHAQQQTNNHEG